MTSSHHQQGRWQDWLWLIVCGVGSSIYCVSAARMIGPTFDEPVYLEKGLEYWRSGSHGGLLRLGTMPLPVDVVTLPLYISERISGRPIDVQRDMAEILPVARSAALLFWWMLLTYAMLIGRRLAGPWGGRLAVLMLAVEPNLVAHAGLATTDIAISACLLLLLYHFWQGRESGWFWRRAVPAFGFGLAMLAKASGLVFGIACMILIEFDRLAKSGALACPEGATWRGKIGHWYRQFQPLRRDMLWIVSGGTILMFVYCGCDWQPNDSFVRWAHGLSAGALKTVMVWISENLCIFRNAGEAIVRQIKHNIKGHGVFILGESSPHSVWYYFPVLITIKLTVPLLLAPLLLGVVRIRSLWNWACLCALCLLLYSVTFRVQIGLRLVFPMVVLAIIGLAAALVTTLRERKSPMVRRVLVGASALGIGWAVVSMAAAWPNGVCYVNELWGGVPRGYRLVSDSNYDWGQGLPELAEWQSKNSIEVVDVWYFGTDPSLKERPFRNVPLHVMPITDGDAIPAKVKGRYLAVSSTILYGGYDLQTSGNLAAAYLRNRTPVDRTTTFFIFDMQRTSTAAATR